MVKLRIQGTPEEVNTFITDLKKFNFRLLDISDTYKNRGQSEYVRIYADIENMKDRKCFEDGKS